MSYRDEIARATINILRGHEEHKELREKLIIAYEEKQIDQDPNCLDHSGLITAAFELIEMPLLSRLTLKQRGWSNRLIQEILFPSIWVGNPGDNKLKQPLYSPTLVRLTIEDYGNEGRLHNQLQNRDINKIKNLGHRQRKLDKWFAQFNNYHKAIAILLRLLNKVVKNEPSEVKKRFYFIKDEQIRRLTLAGYLVYSAKVCGNMSSPDLFCHWFNIEGYCFSLHNHQSLGEKDNCYFESAVPQRYGSSILNSDRDLMFVLSGWKDFNQAFDALYLATYLYQPQVSLIESKAISSFSLSSHGDPPKNDLSSDRIP